MKLRTLLRWLRTSAQLLGGHPGMMVRAPRFLWRTVRDGPRASLGRLRRISDLVDYPAWRAEFGSTNVEKAAMAAWAQALPEPPRIAVLMPVFNPRPEWLQAAIDSVRAQLYPHWQLCIADDCSTDPRIHSLLEAVMAGDSRIQVVFGERNRHICASSNSALELVQAPWLALLDHDDLLSDEALIWVAKAITDHPEAQLIYTDEDKLSPIGEFFCPYFKGDWNPLLMEGQNMFSHLGVYSTALVRQLGGFREGLEGSQDYDLVLRCSEQVHRVQIVHIPRVLYHWRVHPQSTASGAIAKPYTVQAAERAITEHLQRCGEPLQKLSSMPVGFKAQRALPDPAPSVSVIILTGKGLKSLKRCLTSLLRLTRYPDLEVIVVNNCGSDDRSTLNLLAELELQGRIRVLRDPSSFSFSELNNRAVKVASGELICLLKNNIEVIDSGWLEELVVQVIRPGVGAAGAQLLYPNRTLQHAGVLLGVGGVANHAHLGWPGDHPGYFSRAQLAQEIASVTGACLVVRRSHYLAAGGLDEHNLKLAFSDVDFCLKLRQQRLQNVYVPAARLIIHESVSGGQDLDPENAAHFAAEVAWMQQRWGDHLTHDPAYNPNLCLETPHFRLAWPPRLERWDGEDPMPLFGTS